MDFPARTRIYKIVLSIFSVSVVILITCGLVFYPDDTIAMSGSVNSSRFLPCPQSPNCVSSTSTDPDHHIPPLNFESQSSGKVMRVLKQVLLSMTNQVSELENGNALHAEFKSKVFGFVDDVDARLNKEESRIEIRSVSRTGYYDFGVNRRRIERIRQAFNQLVNKLQD